MAGKKVTKNWGVSKEIFRLKSREKKDTRTWFQRDIDQITHSIAFRKLQYKSQLLSEKDPISRSRLIHTIEATRIATEISGRLGLNRDLTEAIMLGHDIASSPYGSIGNKFLSDKVPEFNHELAGAIMLQTLSREKLRDDYQDRAKILDKIDKEAEKGPFYSAKIPGNMLGSKYPLYASKKVNKGNKDKNDVFLYVIAPEVVDGVLCHGDHYKKEAQTLEGQVVKFADNIAYITQDIDDLIRADIMHEDKLGESGLNLNWKKIDDGYPENQKLENIFSDTRGKKIAAFIERYVEQNKQILAESKDNEVPVLQCDDGLQKVIDVLWKFIERHYTELRIETSNYIQKNKLEQLWKILEKNKLEKTKIEFYTKFIDDCELDSRFSYYKTVKGWLCAYFISHLSWYEVDLIIDSYHRRDYSFNLDIDIDKDSKE